jgi:hypothetical protein
MAKVCSICQRPDRASIEEQHVQGSSLRAIASQFAGTSPWSLQRHFAHVPAIIAKVSEHQVQQNRATAKLPQRVEKLIAEAEALTLSARRKRDFASALSAIRTRLACLETIGRLTGELRPGGPQIGEFIPGTAAAAASVTVNMTAPPVKDPRNFVRLLRSIYHLHEPDDLEEAKPKVIPPLM